MQTLSVPIIGYMRCPYPEKFGVPRQSGLVDVPGQIELLTPYGQRDALFGLEQFSHIWVLWHFHQNKSESFSPKSRPPRLGGNKKLGVFATRSMNRPAPIGLSVLKLHKITDKNGLAILHVSGMDMVDGTPIMDIKPYLAYSDSIHAAHSSYAHDPPELLPVKWSSEANDQCAALQTKNQITTQQCEQITALLALNPKPAYHQDQRRYGMRFANVDIGYRHDVRSDSADVITITDITQYCDTVKVNQDE